jgi:flagellar hook-associated protein 2
MARIQSSTGLITGIPIQDTVDKLMQLASQPKDNLTARTQDLQNQKLAVTQLTSLLVAFQFEAKQLGQDNLFQSRDVTSSNPAALIAAVSADGNPALGSYLFTPVQAASAQQLLSQSFASGEAIGAGSFTFGRGGFVDQGLTLDQLNSGAGIRAGKIKITDRNGDGAVIDLSFARTVDDVIDAISNNTSINVKAVASGDSFKLVDNTGGSGNLKVQEVGGGSTAADLGLAGIDVAASTATGTDVFTLHSKSVLSQLNDGNGVQLRAGNDLSVSLADGSTVDIDLGTAKTLGDVITAINAAAPSKLSAAIGSDGNRLQLTDLSTGGGTFAVTNAVGGTAAEDLGLTKAASGNTITGARLVSGLEDTLASSLRGGQGLGTLGTIDITNRNNVTSHVDLSSAETLGQIVSAINLQATGITAAINSSRNGIELTDTTGATTSNLVVADGDANKSATALGLVASTTATQVNSGPLRRQQVSEATLLSSLNGGAGISVTDIKITGTTGVLGAVDMNEKDHTAVTVGDVINKINALNVGVHAQINDRGDGIALVDTAGGEGKITVQDVGNGTAAKDLHILGTSIGAEVNGQLKQVVDGTATTTVTIDDDDKLSDVVTKINALNRGVTASILNDGTRQRLSITSNNTGAANELLLDTSNTRLALQEVSGGKDALMLYGTSGAGGVLISSSTNTFKNVVSGLDITVNQGTQSPVTVNVSSSTSALTSTLKDFVSSYNSLRDNLDKLTAYDATTSTAGVLFASSEALQVDTNVSHLITQRFFGVGQFQSLAEVGINISDKGKLSLDETKLNAAFTKDPDSIKKLFTDSKIGISKKLDAAIERLAGKDDSVLASRTDSLTHTIDSNNDRISQMSDALDKQREALMNQFATLETTVAKMKDNLSALSSLQIIPPLTSSSKSA